MTPLELFIQEAMRSPKTFCVDENRLAVGTDKQGFSPLLDGVKWVSNVSVNVSDVPADWVMLPLCFSYHLALTGAKWTEDGNMRWIADAVKGERPPFLCHVFHDKIAETLKAARDGNCSAQQFSESYRGPRNATFNEVMIILGAGYTRVTTLGRNGHVMLWPAVH